MRYALRLMMMAVLVACEASPPRLVSGARGCVQGPPPAIVLQSAAGEQVATQGGYCARRADATCSRCVDRANPAGEPLRFTTVRPGDEVTISMPDGALVAGTRCDPACPPLLRIERAGCGTAAELERVLSEDEPWSVDLAPGTYWLRVESNFDAHDGSNGTTSASFGLVVDRTIEPAVTDAAVLDDAALPDASCDMGLLDDDAG